MISSRVWAAVPCPAWVKALALVVAAAVLVVVLFEWVFPWASQFLALQEQTVGADQSGAVGSS